MLSVLLRFSIYKYKNIERSAQRVELHLLVSGPLGRRPTCGHEATNGQIPFLFIIIQLAGIIIFFNFNYQHLFIEFFTIEILFKKKMELTNCVYTLLLRFMFNSISLYYSEKLTSSRTYLKYNNLLYKDCWRPVIRLGDSSLHVLTLFYLFPSPIV